MNNRCMHQRLTYWLKKLGLVALSFSLILILWLGGLERMYASVLVFSTNVVLDVGGRDPRISLREEDGDDLFRVRFVYEGQDAHFDQKIQTLLYPTMVLLVWQLFNALSKGLRQSMVTGKWNLGLFFLFQVSFLLLLTAYHFSSAARYIYDLMMESFYVIVLAIIIFDKVRDYVLSSTEKA